MSITDNIATVRTRIDAALQRSGRAGERVVLVAVTKTVSAEWIREALAAGITDIGENRLQEAGPKVEEIGGGPTWHFIGNLQRNKVRQVVPFAELIHSVDRVSLLEEIDKRAAQIDKVQRVLIELNVAGEESKSGVEPAGLDTIVRAAAGLSHVRIEGLMTMAPLVSDPESVRPVFRQTAAIFDKMSKTTAPNVEMTYLSMGMTDDFEVAIEEGSNMVRIGRAIFAS